MFACKRWLNHFLPPPFMGISGPLRLVCPIVFVVTHIDHRWLATMCRTWFRPSPKPCQGTWGLLENACIRPIVSQVNVSYWLCFQAFEGSKRIFFNPHVLDADIEKHLTNISSTQEYGPRTFGFVVQVANHLAMFHLKLQQSSFVWILL